MGSLVLVGSEGGPASERRLPWAVRQSAAGSVNRTERRSSS